MPFIDEAKKGGRRPLNFVEINLDNKLHPSGVENHCDSSNPFGQRFFSSIKSISFAPTKIIPFEGLSHVGQVSIDFNDFEYGAGDYFARLSAMNPYYLNREIYIFSGYVNDSFDISNFTRRLYFIKKMDYDWSARKLTITAKDILSLIEEKGATFPIEMRGGLMGELVDAGGPMSAFAGIIPNHFASINTYAVIDDEIVGIFDGVFYRGIRGTKPAAHSYGAIIRKAEVFQNINPVDALRNILSLNTNLISYIDNDAFNFVRDNLATGDVMNGSVTEPLSIKEITKRICEQFGLNLWFDDESQKIKINAIGYVVEEIKKINWINHIVDKNHNLKKDLQKAVTQSWFYYNKINPTGSDSPENYSHIYISIDPELESNTGHKTIMTKKIFASFVDLGGLGTALKITSRVLSRFKEGHQEISFVLDAKDSIHDVGQIIEIETKIIQDETGNIVPRNFEIVEKKFIGNDLYEYKGVFAGVLRKPRFIAPNFTADYNSASQSVRDKYMFIRSDHLIV